MIEQSASVAAIGAALAKAQATIEAATKDRVNPAFKSKYADLLSVWEACREQLSSNGLSVVQFPGEVAEGRISLTTQLTHESGEWMRSTMSVPLAKVDPQGAGSALTYARRYARAAVVGVCPEDDDGNAASRPAERQSDQRRQDGPRHDPAPRQAEQKPADTAPMLTEEQRDMMMTLLEKTGVDTRDFCTRYGIASVRELPAARFDEAFAAVDAWAKKQGQQRNEKRAAAATSGGSDILDDQVPY